MKAWSVMILLVLVGCGSEAGFDALAQPAEGDSEASGTIGGGVKDAAIASADGSVAVDAGFAGDGTFIAIPAGFTAAQCKFTAAPATIDGNATSIQALINRETGEVLCEKVVQERTEVPSEIQSCTASYTVICVK